jgi:HEAT repeat protein
MFSLPQQKAGSTRPVKNDRPGIGDLRYESSVAFCPHCYAMIPTGDASCPACGADLRDWHAQGYGARLILALNHPLADVRMRAIIALGLRREKAAEQALVECALRNPKDVVEGLEIVKSLRLIAEVSSEPEVLLRLARDHSARAVRAAADVALSAPRNGV